MSSNKWSVVLPSWWTAYFGENSRGETRVEIAILPTSPSACPSPLDNFRIWFRFGSKVNLRFECQINKNRLKLVRRLYYKVGFILYLFYILLLVVSNLSAPKGTCSDRKIVRKINFGEYLYSPVFYRAIVSCFWILSCHL